MEPSAGPTVGVHEQVVHAAHREHLPAAGYQQHRRHRLRGDLLLLSLRLPPGGERPRAHGPHPGGVRPDRRGGAVVRDPEDHPSPGPARHRRGSHAHPHFLHLPFRRAGHPRVLQQHLHPAHEDLPAHQPVRRQLRRHPGGSGSVHPAGGCGCHRPLHPAHRAQNGPLRHHQGKEHAPHAHQAPGGEDPPSWDQPALPVRHRGGPPLHDLHRGVPQGLRPAAHAAEPHIAELRVHPGAVEDGPGFHREQSLPVGGLGRDHHVPGRDDRLRGHQGEAQGKGLPGDALPAALFHPGAGAGHRRHPGLERRLRDQPLQHHLDHPHRLYRPVCFLRHEIGVGLP